MTDTDIAALVERLRAYAMGEPRSGIGRKRRDLFCEAADALEALRAAYDPVAFNATLDALADAMDRAEKAEAELGGNRARNAALGEAALKERA